MNAGYVPLAVFGVLTSVIGAFYYIRIIKVMYVDELGDALDQSKRNTHSLVILAMAAITALLVFALPALRELIEATIPHITLAAV
ncbi:MAG: hypothetical protein EBU10_05210 [Alphaproteobacteria bacterium]|nr:hypothetical protein [Alphaproteobacteria bacterium]